MLLTLLHAVAAGSYLFPFPESFNEMAAVRKSGFLTDFYEGRICKKEQFFPFFYSHKLYIVFAGTPVQLFEALGKM